LNARETATKAIYKINYEGSYTNIVLQEALNSCIKVDKAFVANIIYGTVKNQIYIDWIISKSSQADFEKTDKWILSILRISVYQLYFMDRVPESAVCNEAVKLAKQYAGNSIGSFVNAVLRGITRNKEEYKNIDIKNSIKNISVTYSYPKWLVKLWVEQFGEEKAREFCSSLNKNAQLSIRTNTIKCDREKLKNLLIDKGINIIDGLYHEEAIIIDDTIDVTTMDEYKKGFFVIQDESSMFVSKILDPDQGDCVLDMCCAPAGKTTHMAALMNNKGKIIARDISEMKIENSKKTAKRLGINNIDFQVGDALELDKDFIGSFDKVLVDAPCSGFGVIRRKPDVKFNRKAEQIEEIFNIQRGILDNAALYVKKGGYLLYSTCTLNLKENEENVKYFLENHNFELENLEKYLPKSLEMCINNNMLTLNPSITKTDGFFIAKFKKI
jgi:16S rRNA (cytosine967-C5)-methyltransferase